MSVMPDTRIEQLQFYEAHVGPWTTNATDIGLLAPEVSDLSTKTTAARAAFDAKTAAAQAARAATQTYYEAIEAMGNAGSALMKKIRAKAEQVGGTSVYNLAEIPPPATPAPKGAPGTPYQLKVELKPNGSVKLMWKCNNPAGATGTLYHLYRSTTGDEESYDFIGGAGLREFNDATIPAGAPMVYYKIQAVRTTVMGDAAEFIVKFGTGTSGQTTVSVEQTGPTSLAA